MFENLKDIPESIHEKIIQATRKAMPNEMCGTIMKFSSGYEFWELENIAKDPAKTFEIHWDFYDVADDLVQAIVHSHPNGEPFLSGADRQSQVATDLPWVLAVNGQLKWFKPIPHLRGREFVYDDADCCRLIQDAYHLCGLDLPDCPRIDIDTDIKQQTLLRHFEQSDEFECVHDLRAGDVILTQSGSNTPEHAMLYLGDGEMLHHAHEHLSRREPYHQYWQKCTHSVWRHKKWQPEMMAAIFNDLLHSN